jgi:hypothetical protein
MASQRLPALLAVAITPLPAQPTIDARWSGRGNVHFRLATPLSKAVEPLQEQFERRPLAVLAQNSERSRKPRDFRATAIPSWA